MNTFRFFAFEIIEGGLIMSLRKNRRIITLFVISAVALASCAADEEGLKRDTNKLKNIVTGNTTEVTEYVEETTVPEETTETSEGPIEETVAETTVDPEEKLTPTPTPTPTPKPTPTATPTPEPVSRVDFSTLTDEDIIEGFTVAKEEFAESYGSEDDPFATFEGERLLVTMENNEVPANSVNLILNGFYKEAAGFYARYCDETQAEFDLTREVLDKASVNVSYEYKANDRIIAIKMTYTAQKGEEVTTKMEFEMFDMYTGARIDIHDVSSDVTSLEEACMAKFDESAPEDYDCIMLVPDSDDELIIWMISDDSFYKEHISTEDVIPYLTRYGLSVYGCL